MSPTEPGPTSAAAKAPAPFEILLVEDEATDVELLLACLRRAGVAHRARTVQTESDLVEALAAPADIVLTDYRLPGWDGSRTIAVVRERRPEVPVIVVTGSINEEVAVACMRAGAVDYLLKDNLVRLGPAVVQAIEAARTRRARERAERQLQRLFTAIEQSSEAILVTDANGTIEYVNPAAERSSGWQRDELIGKNPRVFASGVHPLSFYAELWATLHAGNIFHGRFVNRHREGSLYEEEVTITPVRVGGEPITNFVAVKRDLSRELMLERQLAQAQKLEAIGRLAGGIAHDFNNLLAVVLGQAELLAASLAANPSASAGDDRHRVEQICTAAGRGASLTRQLLQFGRRQPGQVERLDINRALGNLLELLRHLLGENVEIETLLAADAGGIEADPSQFDQLVTNLLINARDAMPNGGRITLETSRITPDAELLARQPAAGSATFVRLRVRDTGIGMSAQTRARIFEPFFSTKPTGQGTGLGLATVWGIVQSARGFLDVASALGEGTTFDVYLPHRAAAATNTPATAEPAARGEGTILLVEDQEMLRTLIGEVLVGLGYQVLTAENATRAIALAAAESIDLLLTDVVMPGLSGHELAATLARDRPGLRVLYMSGYTADHLRPEARQPGATLIHKPFTTTALAQAVRAALAAAPPASD